MTKEEKIESLVQDMVRAAMVNMEAAIDLSGKAINRDVPLYIGSEIHIRTLVLAMLREINEHGLFIDK
jgi:hypothetical protein